MWTWSAGESPAGSHLFCPNLMQLSLSSAGSWPADPKGTMWINWLHEWPAGESPAGSRLFFRISRSFRCRPLVHDLPTQLEQCQLIEFLWLPQGNRLVNTVYLPCKVHHEIWRTRTPSFSGDTNKSISWHGRWSPQKKLHYTIGSAPLT